MEDFDMSKKLQISSDYSDFFNNLIEICDSRNTTPTALAEKYASKSVLTAWKNGTINANIVPKLALELNVPIDFLFTNKHQDKQCAINRNCFQDKVRLIEMYEMLTDMEKGEILGELKQMTKKAHIHTAEIAARSTNKEKPKTVTGDFSDILNAPDFTDDYK